MSKLVPNKFPTISASHRIAIIGEAPGADEEQFGEPFIGQSGHLLRNLMSNSGIHPDSALLANVCNFRPPNNYINAFDENGPELQTSRGILATDIANYNPNLCVLLGDTALKLAGETTLKVHEARGTFFVCRDTSSPLYGRKCVSTYHPAAALRQWSYVPLIRLDLSKACRQGSTADLSLPEPVLDIHLSVDEILAKLRAIREQQLTIALDIEGYVNQITCLSIATSADYAFAIDLYALNDADHILVIVELNSCLRDSGVRKILQNSLYDNFALTYTFGCFISNVHWDTMLSGWEIYPELPKNLGTQASIWTDFPAYKHQRKISDRSVHLRYCCTDSVITYAIYERHQQTLAAMPSSLAHFRMNMDMLNVLLYMELRGTRYNVERAAEIAAKARVGLQMINDRINVVAGKKVNINSPKQLCDLLYKQLRFPPQHIKDKETGRKGGLSTNVDAILNIQKTHANPVLSDILAFRKLDKMRVFTEVKADKDGRIRCGYNVVGTETGRLSCYESALGTGTNLQTITKKLRNLYCADEGYYYFQIDLAGADGWTVAAHCRRLGDKTMLEDYLFGLKPAKIIALLHQHGAQVNAWPREQIKEAGKDIGNGETEWLYFACKRVQHGTNYGLGARTMSGQILKDGFKYLGKTIIVDEATCKQLQRLYLMRYPGVPAWQQWVQGELRNKQTLGCASGHVRRFFGRPNDIRTIQAAYSHEPQANTTFATNNAMLKLWTDPDNRRSNGSLIIEPLHQVHDALNGQFPCNQAEWAVQKLRSYLSDQLTIAGQQILIPYDGAYGPTWGDCDPNYGTPVGFI